MISGIPDCSGRLLTLATILVIGGCQIARPLPPDRVNDTPIVEDSAMLGRNWPQIAAVYPSFSTTTGPAEVLLVPKDNLSPAKHAAMETPLFLADIALLPIGVIEGLLPVPWAQVESTSFYLPPTYTANPPLEAGRNPNDYSGGGGPPYVTYAPGRTVDTTTLPPQP